MTRPVHEQNVEAYLRGPGRDVPRRLRLVPWARFVARGWLMPSQPVAPVKRWTDGVRPLGNCRACGMPCVVEHHGIVLHPSCRDPRGETDA